MSKLKVICVEMPFLISYLPEESVQACVYKDEKIYIYDKSGNMIVPNDYSNYIDTVEHAINQGKYEWTDFTIEEGQVIMRDYDYNILIDDESIEPFTTLQTQNSGEISNVTLKLFNEFLKTCNKNNNDMVEALKISFDDGFFRKEVEDIVKNDELEDLSNLDKEIIVRTKIEGKKYIVQYVKQLLNSENYDKYIDINYFFRRVFNLEKHKYISFES